VPVYIHGHVYDSVTGQPIAGATVSVENQYLHTSVHSDAQGYYLGEAVSAASLIIVTADNHAPRCYSDIEIYDSGLTGMNFELNPPVPQGDMNQDGKVDLKDAVLVFQTLTQTVSNICKKTDINGDDKIGFEELIFILKKSAEL